MSAPTPLEVIVRRFVENGIKRLLESPDNVRDLLRIARFDELDLIDFGRLRLVPTTFVQRDYRHIESDVVLQAPLRRGRGARSARAITIYILIEHQSEPEPLMPLRVLEYVVQIYKAQTREWAQRHSSFAHIRLHPVLPVVFYTGTRRWDSLGQLLDLVEMGERFAKVIPRFDPVFVNLPALRPRRLETEGGYLGWVLRLVQERHSRPEEFQQLLRRVVGHLESMSVAERMRWLELLSYIHALVYHDRHETERPEMQRTIEASVASDEHRQEVSVMGKTIAEALREEGMKTEAIRSRRQTLLRLLRQRFGDLPREVVETIETTDGVDQLDAWVDRILKARKLADMGIQPR